MRNGYTSNSRHCGVCLGIYAGDFTRRRISGFVLNTICVIFFIIDNQNWAGVFDTAIDVAVIVMLGNRYTTGYVHRSKWGNLLVNSIHFQIDEPIVLTYIM